MSPKAVIAVAVASALGWPLAASANSDMHSSDTTHYDATTAQSPDGRFMHRGETVSRSDLDTWEVATPFSPNETGTVALPSEGRVRAERMAQSEYEAASPIEVAEVITPMSPNETGAVAMEQQRRHDVTLATVRSLPNPQTPVSINESDASRPMDDSIAYREQLAGIEQAHIAAASGIGTTPGTFEERSVSRNEPEAPTSVDVERQSAIRNEVTPGDVTTPSESSTSAANEVVVPESQPALVEPQPSVGLAPRDRRAFNAEPSTSPDIAQTEPLVPESGIATTPPPSPPRTASGESESSDNTAPGATM